MPFAMALKLKPDLIYLPSDDKFYEETSDKIIKLLGTYKLRMEVMSIDEMALDSTLEDYDEAFRLAETIRSRINRDIGLPCTIGVSISKIYAKMACDAFKPDKVGMVRKEELKKFLENKDVIEIIGVGEKTKEKLNKMKINKISELAKTNPTVLVETFGKFGAELSRIARGEDESGVMEGGPQVSIGRETTLEKNSEDMEEIVPVMEGLVKEAVAELGKRNLWYRSVSGKVRYSDFTVRTKTKRLANATDSFDVAFNTSVELVKELVGSQKVRKVGVRLAELSDKKGPGQALNSRSITLYISFSFILPDQMAHNLRYPNRVIVPVVTPFHKDGSIDTPTFKGHIFWLAARGVDGIVVSGTTGEGHKLTVRQRMELIDSSVDARKHLRKDGFVIISGTGSGELDQASEVSVYAMKAGCNAILALPPSKLMSHDIEYFYIKLAMSVPGFPIFAYNIPRLSNVRIRPHSVAKLVMNGSIIGVKDSSQDRALLREWKKMSPEVILASGSDRLIYPDSRSAGAEIVIAGIGNIIPRAVIKAFKGHSMEATRAQKTISWRNEKLSSTGDYVRALKEYQFGSK